VLRRFASAVLPFHFDIVLPKTHGDTEHGRGEGVLSLIDEDRKWSDNWSFSTLATLTTATVFDR